MDLPRSARLDSLPFVFNRLVAGDIVNVYADDTYSLNKPFDISSRIYVRGIFIARKL